MKETRRGTEDGFTVKEYKAGQEYELEPTPRGEELGRVFIREGWAEEVKTPPAAAPATPPPAKAAPAAPLTTSGNGAATASVESGPAQTKGSRKGQ